MLHCTDDTPPTCCMGRQAPAADIQHLPARVQHAAHEGHNLVLLAVPPQLVSPGPQLVAGAEGVRTVGMTHAEAVMRLAQGIQHVAGLPPGWARLETFFPDVCAQLVGQDGSDCRLQAVEQHPERVRGGALPLCAGGAGYRAAERAGAEGWAVNASRRALPLHGRRRTRLVLPRRLRHPQRGQLLLLLLLLRALQVLVLLQVLGLLMLLQELQLLMLL